MRRLLLHLIIALLTFSIGCSLYAANEIYNLQVQIGEQEKRMASDTVDTKEWHKAREALYRESRWRMCQKKLEAEKKNANTSNMTRCLEVLGQRHIS